MYPIILKGPQKNWALNVYFLLFQRLFLMTFYQQMHQCWTCKFLSSPTPEYQLNCDCLIALFWKQLRRLFSLFTSRRDLKSPPRFLSLLPLSSSLFSPLASFPVLLLHSSQVNFPNALIQIYLLTTFNESPARSRLITDPSLAIQSFSQSGSCWRYSLILLLNSKMQAFYWPD